MLLFRVTWFPMFRMSVLLSPVPCSTSVMCLYTLPIRLSSRPIWCYACFTAFHTSCCFVTSTCANSTTFCLKLLIAVFPSLMVISASGLYVHNPLPALKTDMFLVCPFVASCVQNKNLTLVGLVHSVIILAHGQTVVGGSVSPYALLVPSS